MTRRAKRPRRDSLQGQVVAVNLLLVTATLFAASLAAGLDLTIEDGRRQFLVLAWAAVLCLLVNIMMLRRRFKPLERLIADLEAIDPAQPDGEVLPNPPAIHEIRRLSDTFHRLLERIEAERRRSGRLVLRAQEEERKRVARDLHDEVNQALTAVLLRLEAVDQAAPPELRAELREAKALASRAMDELLGLARQLRPAALDDLGLAAALDSQVRRFSEQTGIRAELSTSGVPGDLSDDAQLVIYRVAQEALSNAARHAGATRVVVDLDALDGCVELRVRDDGRGFDPPRAGAAEAGFRNSSPELGASSNGSAPGGLGIEGMTERARLVGGELQVRSRPGVGTTVKLRVP
jgi:two-component system sensor histidine kinase UhpB